MIMLTECYVQKKISQIIGIIKDFGFSR